MCCFNVLLLMLLTLCWLMKWFEFQFYPSFPFFLIGHRLDTTLIDFTDMKCQRGDLSFIFNGDAIPSESFAVLDNEQKVYQRIHHEVRHMHAHTQTHVRIHPRSQTHKYARARTQTYRCAFLLAGRASDARCLSILPFKMIPGVCEVCVCQRAVFPVLQESEMETEEEVDILMSSDVYSATLSTKSITFSRAQTGWLFREDKTVGFYTSLLSNTTSPSPNVTFADLQYGLVIPCSTGRPCPSHIDRVVSLHLKVQGLQSNQNIVVVFDKPPGRATGVHLRGEFMCGGVLLSVSVL